MVTQGLELLAAVAVTLVPGLALVFALGVRDRLWWAALAAPVSYGVLALASAVTGVTGLRFSVYSVAAIVVVAAAVAFGLRVLVQRRWPAPETTTEPPEGSLAGTALRSAQVAGGVLLLAAIGAGVYTWKRALGVWSTPTQEHDPITHSVMTAYIHFTGHAAPWQLAPLNLVTGKPVSFYPPGLPQLAAIVTDVTGGNAMTGLNLASVAGLAVAWPLSAAAFAAAVARVAGRNQGWTYLAGGVAAVIAVVLYRPAISFPRDGGVLPNAIGAVMVPGIVAAMLTLKRRHWLGALLIIVGVVGAIVVHPSMLGSIAITAVAAALGMLCTREGRSRLRDVLLPLGTTALLGLLVLAPVLVGALGKSGSSSSRGADIPAQTLSFALKDTIGLAYWGYYDPHRQLSQLAVGVLAVAAAVVVVVFRRGWPALTGWLVWAGIAIGFQLWPKGIITSTVGAFYYKGFSRIEAHTYLMVPGLIGVAAVLVAGGLAQLARGWRFAPLAAVGAVVVAVAVLVPTVLHGYLTRNIDALSGRYANPEFDRYDADDDRAADWLHDHAQPGEMIMNNGNDGSTLVYVKFGLPVINTTSMGAGAAPYTVALLQRFNAYPHDAQIYGMLRAQNVRWVYVDAHAPLIGANPKSWVGASTYAFAPGLTDVAGLPGLTPAFRSGHVTVYRLDLGRVPAPAPSTQPAGG